MSWDTVIMLDWSAARDRGPAPKADAIWATRARGGRVDRPIYLRNRALAEDWISRAIETEIDAGRRALVGFDFPFGYPEGLAEALTGRASVFALWDWIEARLEDDGDRNNRFDVAGLANAQLPGVGPFWFNGLRHRDIPDLPRQGSARADHGFPEKREAERRAPGAFSVWQVGGAGAAGGQALVGIAMLNRLRRRFDRARVWPFEPLDDAIALVEIWPSLVVGPAPTGWIKDAWQVHEVARIFSALPPERLQTMLSGAPQGEEGWILGLGFEQELRSLARLPRLENDCFALPPGIDWTPVDLALQRLRAALGPVVDVEEISPDQGLGRILAADAIAVGSHPPGPNSAVDGYGFAGARKEGQHTLDLRAGRAAAGAPFRDRVQDGEAVRVLTGAELPPGVDTVILQEDVTLAPGKIHFRGPVKAGANTRRAGEDIVAGEVVVAAGRRLTAPDLGVLASVGVRRLTVRKPLRVAVLSTGDELAAAGEDPDPGQIGDANRPMLLGLISRLGHVPVDLGIVPDDRSALRQRFDQAARSADVILTSGGASAGDEDHVSALLEETGSMGMWRVAMKPGRPLALGLWQGKPVFGLPGNPVAAMVCTLVFARPALALMAGADWPEPQGFDVPAGFEKTKKAGRREYLRARMRDGRAEVFPSEGSGRISGLSWAEGLVELGDEARDIRPGDLVRFIPWAGFGL